MFTQETVTNAIMSRKIKLPDEEVTWLRKHHNDFTHKELAERYEVCLDTLKRLLMRLELQYFPGAKYQIKPTPESWSRPCILCGCNEPRPKNQYRCDTCVDREGDAERVALDQHQQTQARKKPYKPEVPW